MITVTCLRCYRDGVRVYPNAKALEVASFKCEHTDLHRTLHDQLDTAIDTIRRIDAQSEPVCRDYFDFSIRSHNGD